MKPWTHKFILPSCKRGLPGLLLAFLFTFTVSVVPLRAEPHRNVVNLRGDQVLVPGDVPPKERFVFQRMISIDDRVIVFLYRDARFRHSVDYSETYNLQGELLEIAWYRPTEGLQRARDVNLGNPEATAPARVLEIVHEFREHDRGSDQVTTYERLWLDLD
ncbi:MAG: hypothetical protein V3U14_00880 [candidate division NC10 bacterium]